MNDDVFMLWLAYRSTIWAALLAALAPATIAKFKRRSPIRWYLYGFTCTLVAWPLIALATIHALLVRSQIVSPYRRGPATAAKVRRAGPPRRKQRAIVSKLDSGAQAQIARWDRSLPLCL